jgi:hypothetical protein
MKITDIIRNILDVIDQAEVEKSQPAPIAAEIEIANIPVDLYSDEVRRIKQIAGLMPVDHPAIANAPNEQYADIAAVTTDAGGGPNAPKHPHDLRVKDPSMYPNQQRV